MARADAGESLRLTSNAPSAKRVSCSKIPRRRACHRRRTKPAPHRCHPHSPRSRLGLLVGGHTLPIVRSRSEARADAGESLRLTSNAPSAKRASCSKIPRRLACHRRRTKPAPHRCHPHSPRSRLGLLVGGHTLPIVRSRGWHAQTLGNLCDSRATPRRPSGCPVAKSPGGEHATAGEPSRHRIDATRIPRARAWGFLSGGTLSRS